MEERVYLKWRDLTIGYLIYRDGKYVFKKTVDNTEADKANFPATFIFGKKVRIESDYMPPFMQRFIPDQCRTELWDKCGITKRDNDFQKLVKCTKLNLRKSLEWIVAETVMAEDNENTK